MKYDGTTVYPGDIYKALRRAGVPPVVEGPIADDFMIGQWWNDPKEIARRLRIHGADPVEYFDYFKDLGYEF